MNNINVSESFSTIPETTTATVSCIQWTLSGTTPREPLEPGCLAGFERFFQNSSDHLSLMYIGLTGNHRFKAIRELQEHAKKLGMNQHVTEVKIELQHSFRDRINGTDESGLATVEYDLIKPTASLKSEFISAWSAAVMQSQSLDAKVKIELLKATLSGNINEFIPISSVLFSEAVEKMEYSFRNANAIFFPAFPIDQTNWNEHPARLVAFSKDVIVDIKRIDVDAFAYQ